MKPRVLMLGPLPPPVGGMASVVANLCDALREDCELALLNTVKTTASDRSLGTALRVHAGLLLHLARSCLKARPVVHIHTCSWFSFWRNAADVLVARLCGARVVLHIHGAEFHQFLASLPPARARLARAVLAGCDRVVTLGPRWQALLGDWCDPARVTVLVNGVAIGPAATRPRGAAFTIVCFANYERRKAQDDLIRAVARLAADRPVRLALLGMEAEPGRRAQLQGLARELGITESVLLTGPVSGEAQARWWAAADVFCLPSHNEGLPMAMLEAMARAIPVVVSRVGSVPDAIRRAEEGLLFAPGDVDALYAHLKTLSEDPALAARIGLAGHARCAEGFSLEASRRELLALYRTLA